MSDTEGAAPRLTVVCTDGTEIGCTNFKAIDSGLLLTDDLTKNRVFGFVAQDEVRFVLPTETAERVVAEAASDEEGDDEENDEFEDPLMRLPGLGTTYAKRLRSSGYTSVAELADADAETLAEETGANESQATEWVERAREQVDGKADGSGEDSDEDDGENEGESEERTAKED
ncbi:helix-hairpin-helix domain-containing protein [Halogeometricum limi]|uniref:Helix-hairpin-helix domain-containing protein n=1 Tax=Halogeometricum limi TaxID=555875 RepID=A0A1I6ID95_9EURY|nr:helix-hairpin-helix domain-containing protein [Halogeometricum limi]SFR64663.1 Helix-hairpin-helix domain-containing protein [Halogeometricum limi]